MKTIQILACLVGLSSAELASGEPQPVKHCVVLIDLSPSMKPYRAQQLEAVKTIIESWQPNQAIDFLAVNENPLGRAPLGHIAPFLYDKTRSNPTRYRMDSAMLRKKYLGEILTAVQQAIAAEDEKNKKHPNIAETCLLDGLEAAARAFRRVPSQSREIILLTDGYEDCRGSMHLPRDPLSPARIEAIIREFDKQGRLPRFASPTTVYFVGTRQSGATTRRFEDLLESFWISLLSRCGAQLRPDSFTPTLQGANMYTWPDDMALLLLNGAGDRLILKSTFNTNLAFGDMGSGKTSGFAAHLLIALLRAMTGGYLPAPKPTDYGQYMKHIRLAGREGDVILIRPTASWNETPINCINVLDFELRRFGRGEVSIANVTALLMKVIDLIQRQGGQGATNEAFWRSYAEKIIKAGLTAQSIVSKRIDLKLLLKFVNELPNSFQETEERSSYAIALMREAKATFGENAPFDFMLHYDFVMREWPLTPPNARGSGALTVQVLLTKLLSHPLRQLLFEDTSFDLNRVLNGQGILLLDMNVHDYTQGAIAGMILKDVIQRACQNRPELNTVEPHFIQPVFQLIDEYPNYAVDEDEKHSLMARSARSIPIYISQSVPALLSRFIDKEKAESQIEVPGCRWLHQTGSMKTAKWMSDTIGEILVDRMGRQHGTNWNHGPNDQFGRNEGYNFSQQKEYECPPRAFTRLLRGGPENGLRTEAIFWRNGDKFRLNGRRYLPVCFPQDFKPGRDEVKIIAHQKGGRNNVSTLTSLLSHPLAQDGRDRLRKLLG